MKTETFYSTGADIMNCLHSFYVVYIYFALDS